MENVETIDEVLLIQRDAVTMSNELITRGDRDEVMLNQPTEAPKLSPGLKMQICCNYFDNDTGVDNLKCFIGTVSEVSNGKNLRNHLGKFLRKEASARIA